MRTNSVEYLNHILEKFQVNGMWSDEGLETTLNEAEANKAALRTLFSAHPLWDAEKRAIIIPSEERHTPNWNDPDWVADVAGLLEGLRYNGDVFHPMSSETKCILRQIRAAWKANPCSVLNEEFCNSLSLRLESYEVSLPEKVSRKFKPGTKFLRFLNAVFANGTQYDGTQRDYTQDSGYNKAFASLAAEISETSIPVTYVITTELADFLTMSNGNSWSSCHFINSHGIFHEDAEQSYHGMYKQGCISYGLDNVSFLVYSYTGNHDEPLPEIPKKARMVCQYEQGTLISGKLYPDNRESTYTEWLRVIEGAIAMCGHFDCKWTSTADIKKIKMFCKTAPNAAHYPDYCYEHQNPHLAIATSSGFFELDHRIEIGHPAYCLYCGLELNAAEASTLQCRRHRRSQTCFDCGCVLTDDNCLEYEDGEETIYLCTDCAYLCDECGEVHRDSEDPRICITINGETRVMTEYEAEHNYQYCDFCGEYYTGNHCPNCELEQLADMGLTVERADSYEVGDLVLTHHTVDSDHLWVSYESVIKMRDRILKVVGLAAFGEYIVSRCDDSDSDMVLNSESFYGRVTDLGDWEVGDIVMF